MTDTVNSISSKYANKITYPIADTEYRSGTSSSETSIGGPASAPIYGTGAQIEATAGMNFPSSYDKTKLDNYVVNSFNIHFTVGSKGMVEDVEIIILPQGWYNMTAENEFNTIKSATILAKTGSIRSENSVVNIPITSIDTMRTILTQGIGWRKVSNALSSVVVPIAVVINYGDAIFHATLTAVSPNNNVVIGNNDIILTWSVTENETTQTHYDLQYSHDEGEIWTTLANKVAGNNTAHTIPGGTLASGNYLWRVRIYGYSGTKITNWTQAAFTVVNNANTSNVTCDGKPMPTITWTASEQAAYQVKIGNYDSGTVFGESGTHRPARYFSDGVYVVTVRTQTTLGVWSAWTEPLYTNIINTPGADIILSAYQDGFGVGLVWATDSSYVKYYVLRDGVPIACTAETTYTDSKASGEHIYTVLAPRYGENYTMSNPSTLALSLKHDIISLVDNINWLPLRYALGSLLTRGYTESDTISYRYFAGRDYPVAFRANQKSRKATLRYAFKTPAEADAIRALIGKLVIFKDRRGNRVIGMLDGINRTVGMLNDVSLNITEVEYNERVEYDTEYIVG